MTRAQVPPYMVQFARGCLVFVYIILCGSFLSEPQALENCPSDVVRARPGEKFFHGAGNSSTRIQAQRDGWGASYCFYGYTQISKWAFDTDAESALEVSRTLQVSMFEGSLEATMPSCPVQVHIVAWCFITNWSCDIRLHPILETSEEVQKCAHRRQQQQQTITDNREFPPVRFADEDINKHHKGWLMRVLFGGYILHGLYSIFWILMMIIYAFLLHQSDPIANLAALLRHIRENDG